LLRQTMALPAPLAGRRLALSWWGVGQFWRKGLWKHDHRCELAAPVDNGSVRGWASADHSSLLNLEASTREIGEDRRQVEQRSHFGTGAVGALIHQW